MSAALCPKCQRPLPANAPEGMCPRCLYENLFTPDLPVAEEFVAGGGPVGGTRTFGDYELLEEVARGGMGVVFRARHQRLNRVVALKMVLAPHLVGEVPARRFRHEAEAAASLDHPNIVPIYEVGEADGRLFYTMKFIEGGSLASRISNFKFGISNRAAPALVAKVARAVHHAHQRGLLHRDVKPSNILLDAEGEPAVADFGLARWMEKDSDLTHSDAIVGSPSYMAPEQAAGRAQTLTTAADVYSLGAVLFFLLTGRPPFTEETAVATMRAVVEREAPRPSSLNAAVDRDLDTICLKCLAKDPAGRYTSARALAEDLERWQRGEPIVARPAPPWELAVKWARRNPAWTLFFALVALTPAVMIPFLLISNARVRRAQAQTHLNLYAADMQVAHTALEDANLTLARRILDNYQPRLGEPDLRGFEWRYLWHRARSGQLRLLRQHTQPINCLAFSPDGNWLASCEIGRTAWFWNTTTWRPERVIDWSGESQAPFRWISFSHDGAMVAVTMDGNYSPLFDGRTLQPDFCIYSREPEGAHIARLLWSPRGHKLAFQALSSQGRRFIGALDWDAFQKNPGRKSRNLADGFVADRPAEKTAGSFPDAPVTQLADADVLYSFTADGQLLAGRGGGLVVFDLERGGAESTWWSAHRFDYAELSSDGKFLAGFNSLPKDRHSVLMDEFKGGVTNYWEMIGHEGGLLCLAISPNSRQIVSGSADHTARVWDVATRKTVAHLRGHAEDVTAVAWSPDGRLVATGSRDRTVMLWSAQATNQTDGQPESISGTQPPWIVAEDDNAFCALSRETDGSGGGRLAVWNLEQRERLELPVGNSATPVSFARGGRGVLFVTPTVEGDFELRAWSPASRAETLVRRLPLPQVKTASLIAPVWAVSCDQRWIAHSGERGNVHLWRVDAPDQPALVLPGNQGPATRLAFAPDGRVLAVGQSNHDPPGVVDLWRMDDPPRRIGTMKPQPTASVLAWSPDSRTLATAGDYHSVQLWDARTARRTAALAGHKRDVTAVAFSPGGHTLASTDGRTLKLWQATTGREMLTIYRDLKIGEPLQWLAFTADGTRLLAADDGGRVQTFLAPALDKLETAAESE